jgi:hypothetical protein
VTRAWQRGWRPRVNKKFFSYVKHSKGMWRKHGARYRQMLRAKSKAARKANFRKIAKEIACAWRKH